MALRTHLRRAFACLLVMASTAGCYDWRPTTVAPVAAVAEEGHRHVRVTFEDGTSMNVRDATVVNDSIVGNVGPRRARVSPNDLSNFEVPRFNTLKTTAFVASGAAVIVGFIAAVIWIQPHYKGF